MGTQGNGTKIGKRRCVGKQKTGSRYEVLLAGAEPQKGLHQVPWEDEGEERWQHEIFRGTKNEQNPKILLSRKLCLLEQKQSMYFGLSHKIF